MTQRKELPEGIKAAKELPSTELTKKELPKVTENRKTKPPVGNQENMVKIGDTIIEIKPTKLKYMRTGVSGFFRALELYSLPEILMWDENAMGDGRDGDKALMDWLISALDNEEVVVKYYDEIDSETVEKILEIFKRVNKIDEKEENRSKNALKGKTEA